MGAAGVVIDLDGVRHVERQCVFKLEVVPRGMRDSDKGAGLCAATRKLDPSFVLSRGREIGRQAYGQDMPVNTPGRFGRVHLGAK